MTFLTRHGMASALLLLTALLCGCSRPEAEPEPAATQDPGAAAPAPSSPSATTSAPSPELAPLPPASSQPSEPGQPVAPAPTTMTPAQLKALQEQLKPAQRP